MLDVIRQFMTILMWMIFPPCFLFWISIHGLFAFWRRVGVTITYTLHAGFIILMMAAVYQYRHVLIGYDLGWNTYLASFGVLLWIYSAYMETKTRQFLSLPMMIGVPELNPKREDSTLLTDGIFSRTRNPRYVLVYLYLIGWTLFANYTGMYMLLILTGILIYTVVWLEERELHNRFGKAYEEYCQNVPRFIPTLFRAK